MTAGGPVPQFFGVQMTSCHDQKKEIRARMALTGETYSQAKAAGGAPASIDAGWSKIDRELRRFVRAMVTNASPEQWGELARIIYSVAKDRHSIPMPSSMDTFVAPPIDAPCLPGTNFPILLPTSVDPEGRLCRDSGTLHTWDMTNEYKWGEGNTAVRCAYCGIRRLRLPGSNSGGAACHWSKLGLKNPDMP